MNLLSKSNQSTTLQTSYKDGIYTISRGDGWIRGNKTEDIIGDLILSPGVSGNITRTKECTTEYSFAITSSATFTSEFIEASLELSLELRQIRGESTEYEYFFTAPADKSIYCRLYQTYFRDEVITVENGKITNKAISYTPSGVYSKKINFIEGTKVNTSIIDEPIDRCILGEKKDIKAIIDVNNRKEVYKSIPKEYRYGTNKYDSNVNVDLYFTIKSSGMYHISPEDKYNAIILYEVKAEEYGQVQQLIRSYPGAEKKAIISNLDEDKEYVLRIIPNKNSAPRKLYVDFHNLSKVSKEFNNLSITYTGQSVGMLFVNFTRKEEFFGILFDAPPYDTHGMDIRLKRGSAQASLYRLNNDNSVTLLSKFQVSDNKYIVRHGEANKSYMLVIDRRSTKDTSPVEVSIDYYK